LGGICGIAGCTRSEITGLTDQPKLSEIIGRGGRRNMSGGGDEAWAAIKQAYEAGELSVGEICRRHGVTPGQMNYRRRRDSWPPRLVRVQTGAELVKPVRPVPESPLCEGSARPGRGTGVPVTQHEPTDPRQFSNAVAKLMERLFRVTEKELSIIEERMEMGEIRSPADSARDTSSIGSLIKNLEKLTEFNEQVRGGQQRGSIAGITADEADRIRRELARRIERITKG